MNDDKIDDEESLAPTIRPPKIITPSNRPTFPIVNKNKQKKTWFQKYLNYIILILVLFLICEIVFIGHNAKSSPPPPRPVVIYNLPPVSFPTMNQDAGISVTPSIDVPLPPSQTAPLPQPIKQIPKIPAPASSSKMRDYGINDLIQPYDTPVIYKL